MADFGQLKIEALSEIDTDKWNDLIICLEEVDDKIPDSRWKFNDLIIDNDTRSAALHLRNDAYANSYITNRNGFVENGTSENNNLIISSANHIRFQTDSIDENHGYNRLVINQNGNVGIGTATPNEKLEVAGNIRADQLMGNPQKEKLAIFTKTDPKDSKGFIELWEEHSSRSGELTLGGGYVAFYTGSTNSSFGKEVLRIDSEGKVGIGTASPTEKLHVKGTVYSIHLKSSSNLTIGGKASINKDLKVDGNASMNKNLSVGGNTSVNKNLTVSGTTKINGDLSIKSKSGRATYEVSVGPVRAELPVKLTSKNISFAYGEVGPGKITSNIPAVVASVRGALPKKKGLLVFIDNKLIGIVDQLPASYRNLAKP